VAINTQTGQAVITHEKLNQISVVDPSTQTVLSILSVGKSPDGVAVNATTNQALVSNEKADSLTLVDLAVFSIVGSIAVERNPRGVAIHPGSNISVSANKKSDTVSIIDLFTVTLTNPAPVGKDPQGVGVNINKDIAVVANKKNDTVSILDLPQGTLSATISVGRDPQGVAINPQTDQALVTNKKDNSLTLIDLMSLQATGTLNVGKDPNGVAINPTTNRAVVANKKDNTVSIVDLSVPSVVSTVSVGKDPTGVSIDDTSNQALITLEKDDAVMVLDLTSETILNTIPVGEKPQGIAIDTGLNLSVIANKKSNSLSVIDLATKTLIQTVNVGKDPIGVAVHPLTQEAFVANHGDDTVSVVDLTTYTITETIPVGNRPRDIAIHPALNLAVVTNEGSDDVTILILGSPPVPTIDSFSPTSGLIGDEIIITGDNFDPDPANNTVQFNGVQAVVTAATVTSITTHVPSGATTGPISVTTPGGMGTSATDFTVILEPVITSFSPTSGLIGTPVTITGQNFDEVASNNQVDFNGTQAIITSATATQITTTVPQGASTGLISVTTPQGTGTSSQDFVVNPTFDFSISAVPSTLTLLQDIQSTSLISLSSTGAELFTGLASLTISGLPAGASATFNPPQMSTGQLAQLQISVSGTTAVGSYPITITGSALIQDQTVVRSANINLDVQIGGRTALSGQFLTIDGKPIPGIQLSIGAIQTQTDDAGNFLLVDVPSGTQQLMVDANAAQGGYPIYAIDHTLTANQVTVLKPFRITPPPPASQFTDFNNTTADQVITDPRYPRVSVTMPSGVTIIGWDGDTKTKMAIERLSPDRLPVPSPPGPTRSLYQLFFGTPRGGVPSASLPVSGPNDLGLDPGEEAELWYFDASPMGGAAGWTYAGNGTVSSDGSTIVSNSGVGIDRFCGVCGLWCWIKRQATLLNRKLHELFGADPIDLLNGQMIVEKTDMVLPGRIPINLSRTYNPVDPFGNIAGFQSALGPGWFLSVDTILMPITTDLWRLVLPGNARLDLSLQPDGTFQNNTDPFLIGAVLTTLPGGDHQLHFKDGTTWRFQSIVMGLEFLIEIADRNGNRITIERDSESRVSRIVDDVGRALEITLSGSKIGEIRDPIGRTIQYTYNTNGLLETVIDPNGGVTQYTYDTQNRILTITDAKNIQYVENFYGTSGKVLRQLQAANGEWLLKYEMVGATVSGPGCPGPSCPTEDSWANFQAGYTFQDGEVIATTVIDPLGNETTYRFNNSGYPIEKIDGLGQNLVMTRNSGNLLTSSTDPLGWTTSFSFDGAGNVTSTTDADGNTTTFTYEPTFNRVASVTDAQTNVTTFTYDSNGNLVSTTDPLTNTTTLTYNPFGQPVGITDPIGNPTSFEYDEAGNLKATVDPLGNRTERFYDPLSRLIALTDPRGLTTFFDYDPLNRVTQITDAKNGITGFTYDENGNLLTVTDANSNITTYTYDGQDRVDTRTDPLLRTETYVYDFNGNLIQYTDRKGQVTDFTYDNLNRRILSQYADGSSTSFTYDSVGNLIQVNDSISGAIDFSYDNLNRLVSEITPQGVVTYGYDNLGRRTSMAVNGQIPVTYQYDSASRLTQVAQGPQIVGLGYDAAGRRTSLSYPNGVSTSYVYDQSSRLLQIEHLNVSTQELIEQLGYTYDAAGNRISLTRSNWSATLLPDTVQAAYDAANEQIQFDSPTPNLTYDANGNLTSQTDASGTTTYTWDARNRLVGISGPGVSASFVYDALGRRITKTINGVTTDFQYDGNDIVSEESGAAVSVTYLRSLNIDKPFIRKGSSEEYYHTDALGSSVVLTDSSGAIDTFYEYEAFGETTVSGTSTNPFQFTGRENDGIGQYYYRKRYYNPGFSRFISEDPLECEIRKGNNLYTYVRNNPILFRDPMGLQVLQYTDDVELCLVLECPRTRSVLTLQGVKKYILKGCWILNTGIFSLVDCVYGSPDKGGDGSSGVGAGVIDPGGIGSGVGAGIGFGPTNTAGILPSSTGSGVGAGVIDPGGTEGGRKP
jgi:RHS repeat-associated protein